MSFVNKISWHRAWFTGLILIVVSLLIFCNPALFNLQLSIFSGQFLPNYFLAFLYLIILLWERRRHRENVGLPAAFLLLVLLLISAYALNRDFPIFEKATDWWVVALVLSCLNYMSLPFFHRMPSPLQHLVCLMAGGSLLVFLYLSIYLIPLYAFGALFSFLGGISLHSFVPLLFFIYTIIFIRRAGAGNRKLYWSCCVGVGLVTVFTIIFIVRWTVVTRKMNDYYTSVAAKNQGLPAWVYTAEHLSRGTVTEKVLKAGLVYCVYNNRWGFSGNMLSTAFAEERKHDPLVVLGTLFGGESVLPEEERIKILESLYDSRHQAQARLWRGDDLSTEKIKTSVELWPGLHLSYTEKNITVTNKSSESRWNNQQEAIYTFHLPEGAVVSSLSLWINGKEEKAQLASQQKADSAYRTVVGYENRDPSVVHWQEGNTVSVRVFPVVAGQSRLFTLGITAPLQKRGDELVYQNIYFDGPSPASATETVSIHSEAPLPFLHLPSFFPSGNERRIWREGKYQAEWGLRFKEKGLDKTGFIFEGKRYAVQPYLKERGPMNLHQVYLDVNRSWSRKELESVFDLVGAMPGAPQLFVHTPETGRVVLTKENKDSLFRQLVKEEFSIFPLFEIDDTAGSLLISKSSPVSPTLADLGADKDFGRKTTGAVRGNDSNRKATGAIRENDSNRKPTDLMDGNDFGRKLQHWLSRGEKVRLFNLGDELSPYLKALKEFRAFRYEAGGLEDLRGLLTARQFAEDPETSTRVVIDPAEMMISRIDEPVERKGAVDSTGVAGEPGIDWHAPDHVLRLFAYNHILQNMGEHGTDPKVDLIREAEEAHIVSPVSSLVVLETQSDYQRFNIEDSKNSLQNASLHSKGSVPEPGQWVLLIVVVLTFLYVLSPSGRVKAKTGHS